jgi:arylsulfatase A-like enzyme
MNKSASRRSFLSSIVGTQAALALSRQRRPPNFLIIFSDDQGYHDVGCYGSEIPTPHTDSIARNGVKFDNFYVAGPICTPSRYGLLTGRYPARSKDQLLGALMPGSKKGIHPGETTMAEVLSARGYRTALIGKWHLGYAKPEFLPTRHGFQYFDGFVHGCIDFFDFSYGGLKSWYRNEDLHQPARGYTTDYLTDQALRFLHENQRHPFLLYLPYNAPHYGKLEYDPATRKARNGLQAPEEYIARFAHIKDENRRVYAAMVASMDDNIGRLLKALRQLKLEEDTLVVFLSDNGGSIPYGGSNVPLRGQKGDLFEGGIRVPCLMQWKGKLATGKTVGQVAGAVDLFPTLASLAGAPERASRTDGRDLAPALFEGRHFERELFWRTRRTDAYLKGYWKYIKISNGEEFLFDLEHDPNEQVNRIDDRAKLQQIRAGYLRVKATLPET